ncbi:glycosyltransferase family 4 protein [Burkholderia latens]|nr:glycosyltransferase family 4 protein [Burkholderia latens]
MANMRTVPTSDARHTGPASMSLCFFIANMAGFGGTERAACAIASGLAARPGVADVHMLALAGETSSRFALDRRIRRASLFDTAASMTRRYVAAIARLRAYVARHRIDTLVVVESTLCLYAIPAALGLPVRVICWEHFNFSMNGGRRKRTVARYLAALLADDVVTLTERDKAVWQKKTIGRARLHAIPNPSSAGGKRNGYDRDARTMLAVGRLVGQKGFDLLLDAWHQVKAAYPADGWQLTIVGDGDDRQALLAQAERLGLSGSVSLVPATQAIDAYYGRAAVFVCSSRQEGLPMVLIEASQWGVPIVSFDCETGPREIVEHRVSGLLVPNENVRALAQAMLELMRDDALRARFADAAIRLGRRFEQSGVLAQWSRLIGANADQCPSDSVGERL